MTLKIRLISDLHLEYYYVVYRQDNDPTYALKQTCDDILNPIIQAQSQPDTASDILIILGDVCPIQFTTDDGTHLWSYIMTKLSKIYGPHAIIFVPGNHEYYGCKCGGYPINMTSCDLYMHDFCNQEEHDIIYLNNGQWCVIDGVAFVGATGWTDTPHEIQDESWGKVDMNDYVEIDYLQYIDHWKYCQGDKLSSKYAHQLHRSQMKHMQQSIDQMRNDPDVRQIVALTHHVPLYHLCLYKQRVYGKDISRAYCARDIDHLVDKVNYWFYGHTHDYFYKNNKNKTVLITNARGRLHDFMGWEDDQRIPFSIYFTLAI